MQLKNSYKVAPFTFKSRYVCGYFRPWWFPLWFRCRYGVNGMHLEIEDAENDCKQHAHGLLPTQQRPVSRVKFLGKLP